MKKQKGTIEIRYNYLIDPEYPDDDCDGGDYYSVDVIATDEEGEVLQEFNYGDEYHDKGADKASACSEVIEYNLGDKYKFETKITTKCIEE